MSVRIDHECLIRQEPFELFTSRLEQALGLMRPAALDEIGAIPASMSRYLLAIGTNRELLLYNLVEHPEGRHCASGPKLKQYYIGNPVIAQLIANEHAAAAQYLPIRIFVYEAVPGTVHIEFEWPSTQLARFDNERIRATGAELDERLKALLLIPNEPIGTARSI